MADAPDQPNGTRRTDLDRLREGAALLRTIAGASWLADTLDPEALPALAAELDVAVWEIQERRSGLGGGAPPLTKRWNNVALPAGVHPENEGI